jgi:hypothetical protein
MHFITLDARPVPAGRIQETLEAHHILTNRHAEVFMAHPRFDPEAVEKTEIVIASLREIGLEDGGTLEEIFRQTAKIGYRPCPVNTGLFLRLAWKDQPPSRNSVLSGQHRSPDGAVVVLSEIPEPDDRFPKGLYLRNVGGQLWLRGYICDAAFRYAPEDLFAFAKGEA